MIMAAPEDHEDIGYAMYYLAAGHEQLGNCGAATRAYEAIVYGEIDISSDWVDAAWTRITAMQNDNGKICDNWN